MIKRANRRYLALIAGVTVAALAACVALNLVIDPFDIYGRAHIGRLEPFKRRLTPALAEQMLAGQPRTLIVGTSRVGQGLRGGHPIFDDPGTQRAPIFGARWRELYHLMRFALQQPSPPKLIVLGLDEFTMTDNDPNAAAANFEKSRFSPGFRALDYHARNLASTYAVSESIKVVTSSFRGERRVEPLGQIVVRLGNGHMFSRSLAAVGEEEHVGSAARLAPCLDELRELVRLAHSKGTRLVILFLPIHATHIEALYETGQGPLLESFKRSVTETALDASDGDAEVWDFTGYGPVTTEPIPPIGQLGTPMEYHYDSHHFSPELGAAMMRRVLGGGEPKPIDAELTGVRLTAGNLDAHLAEQRRQRLAYREAHPDQVRFVQESLRPRPKR